MNARDKHVAMITPAICVADRASVIDWMRVSADLDAQGHAVIAGLISPAECDALAALYSNDAIFRSRVVMAEQRPRMQTRPMVVPLRQGDAR